MNDRGVSVERSLCRGLQEDTDGLDNNGPTRKTLLASIAHRQAHR